MYQVYVMNVLTANIQTMGFFYFVCFHYRSRWDEYHYFLEFTLVKTFSLNLEFFSWVEKNEQENVYLVVILLRFSQKGNVTKNIEEIPKGFGPKKAFGYEIRLLRFCGISMYRTGEPIFRSCIANKKNSSKLEKATLPLCSRKEINKYEKIAYQCY